MYNTIKPPYTWVYNLALVILYSGMEWPMTIYPSGYTLA